MDPSGSFYYALRHPRAKLFIEYVPGTDLTYQLDMLHCLGNFGLEDTKSKYLHMSYKALLG